MSDSAEKLAKIVEFAKENAEEIQAGIAKLSPAAQGPATEIAALFVSGQDPETIKAEIERIRSAASEEVQVELDAHRDAMAAKMEL